MAISDNPYVGFRDIRDSRKPDSDDGTDPGKPAGFYCKICESGEEVGRDLHAWLHEYIKDKRVSEGEDYPKYPDWDSRL